MINKEQLLTQKTSKQANIELLEKLIDKKLSKIQPDIIKNKEFSICIGNHKYNYDFDNETIDVIKNKYQTEGNYKRVICNKNKRIDPPYCHTKLEFIFEL
ncbi:hypothetical protein ACSW9O_16125 (plasmid) [Clostridium perfringens]